MQEGDKMVWESIWLILMEAIFTPFGPSPTTIELLGHLLRGSNKFENKRETIRIYNFKARNF